MPLMGLHHHHHVLISATPAMARTAAVDSFSVAGLEVNSMDSYVSRHGA